MKTEGEEFVFPDEKGEDEAAAGKKAAPADDLEIEVVDDTPEKDKGRPALDREVVEPNEDELQQYSEKVQARIKELTHARHDERRSKEAIAREKQELERLATALREENEKLRVYVDTGSKQYIEQAQTIADKDVEEARAKLRAAQESFDSEAIATAQEALMDAKMKAQEAKKFRPTALQAEKPVVQPRQQPAAAAQPDERTLRWQQENQWFGADGKEDYSAYALGLHQKLVNSGVDPKSDAYFEQLNKRLRQVFPELYTEQGEQTESAPSQPSKKPAAVVAPATRSSGVKKVQLTKTQVALANKLNIPLQQYAAHVAQLEKQNG